MALYDVNPTERPNVTLKEIYSEWSQEKYTQISKSTVDNYKACYLKLSSLYNRKFKDLRTAHFQVIKNERFNKSFCAKAWWTQELWLLIKYLYPPRNRNIAQRD